MNTLSRTITGTLAIILGLILIGIGFFVHFVLIYGIPILVIGILIFLNKKEDYITPLGVPQSTELGGKKIKVVGGKK